MRWNALSWFRFGWQATDSASGSGLLAVISCSPGTTFLCLATAFSCRGYFAECGKLSRGNLWKILCGFLLLLCPPYAADADIIFSSCTVLFSSPNLSSRRLDAYHTSTQWCGLCGNLECRSKMCCTWHVLTIGKTCQTAMSLPHVSTIW